MEGGGTMVEDSGDMAEYGSVRPRLWGLRPWKRHSLILMVGGFLYALIGFLFFQLPPNPGRESSLKVVLQVAPLEFWGSVFMFSGLLSMISSRWPPFSEKWGYMVLTGMSSGWASTYLLGVIFFDSPSGNWFQALVWSVLAFMWWAISGLSNPDHSGVRPDERI
jgi:hypothetical protein